MEDNRSFIINRLKAKAMSIEEFNFDALQAPPIAAMFSPMDIAQLNQIAKSLKYSAKPQIKYQEIDKIMRRRGFVKFGSGTNRVIYRPIEDNSFLVKIAYDAIGSSDNPREIVNQQIFKPFIPKEFETTPCGTLATFERVVPISSREEFLSVAEDIFEVINKWFIGEYILEDIGTNYFMNWGIRKGFGPVLLDYPYVYKLDGNKLFCNAPNPNNPSGCCEGIIDYDAGYNFLHCTKCGVKYRAKELELAIKENNILVKSEGDFKMKVKVKGGSKNVQKTITTGEYSGQAKSMPTKPIKGRDEKLSNTKLKQMETEEVVETVQVKEEAAPKKEVVCPIEFDESLKNKSDKEKTPVENFNEALKKALEIFEKATEEDKESMSESIYEAFKEEIEKAVKEATKEEDEPVDEVEAPMTISRMDSIINQCSDEVKEHTLISLISDDNFDVSFECSDVYYDDEDSKLVILSLKPIICKLKNTDSDEDTSVVIYECESKGLGVAPTSLCDSLRSAGYNINEVSTEKVYNGCQYFAAVTMNIKDIFQNEQPSEVMAIVDKDGNYLTINDNQVVIIDLINDRSIDSVAVVSSNWLNSILNKIDVEDDEIEDSKVNAPTGTFAPEEVSVNGVPVEE